MHKIILSFVLALFSASLFGQSFVSTTPENKKVILEEFTGIYCGYCPSGHAIAQSIMGNNTGNAFVINIHEGSFANPAGNHPDFRTPFGTAIAGQSGLTGYPSGTVNRQFFSNYTMGSGTAMGRSYWSNAANTVLNQSAYVNVGVETEIDVSTREITVNIEVFYTGSSPENTNFLNIALLQDNTIGYQSGGGTDYNHNHRLVWLLTDQWGDEITNTTENSFFEKTYTYTIPEDYNGIEAKLADMKIVAFVTETRQEIINGNGAIPAFTNHKEDWYIKSVKVDKEICGNQVSPTITVVSQSTNSISEIDIRYSVNNEEAETFKWTGNLESLREVEIELPAITFSQQAENNLTAELLLDDENTENNSASVVFEEATKVSNTVILEIKTDSYGSELTWKVEDSGGNIVYSGGPYSNGTAHEIHETFELPDACYSFQVYDSYGDGLTYGTNGYLFLKDTNGTELMSYPTGDYGSGDYVNFGTDATVNVSDIQKKIAVFPNPATETIYVSSTPDTRVEFFSMQGKLVKSSYLSGTFSEIDVSDLQNGIFILRINNKEGTQNKKLVIFR